MQHAGIIIKTLRERFGYSQDAIAKFLGVKREMISYYETQSREPSLEVLEKLADLFGVDLEVFFADSIAEASTELAFAFRAEGLNEKDLKNIAAFKRIIKNYQRITTLEKKNV